MLRLIIQMGSDEAICRFVHASDLHIGRFQYTNATRAMDYINGFQKLLEDAYRTTSDFILLAGDVFNSIDLLPFYFAQVVKILRKFQEKTKFSVPVIAIEGNHDIRSFSKGNRISTNLSWLKVLSGLGMITLLDSTLEDPNRNEDSLTIKGARIYGNTYCGERIDTNLNQILRNIPFNGAFNILINHFGVEGTMKGIPGQSKSRLDSFLKSRINYLGLGHFHKQYVLDGYIYNPGCLSPACLSDFNLPHGYFLVDVRKELNKYKIHVKRNRIRERQIIWKILTFKSKPKSKQELFESIKDQVKKNTPLVSKLEIISNTDLTPVLCLTVRSVDGKLLSTAVKKELRAEILQNFPLVEVHIFQKQILYKSIEGFFKQADVLHKVKA